MGRQSAYALRARAGAQSFAAAWDSAACAAARRRIAARRDQGLYARAVEGVAVPIPYRRAVVAVERRYDDAALVRRLGIADPFSEKR
ncbi:MAG TPA: hypothetical protein VGX37_02320 [Allosphingosinicella sp.]|jgi:hypothetical protein|nr:hypothetical protein [Allosphingosinicella sp.]